MLRVFPFLGVMVAVSASTVCFGSSQLQAQESSDSLGAGGLEAEAEANSVEAEPGPPADIQAQWPVSLRVGLGLRISDFEGSDAFEERLSELAHGEPTLPVAASLELVLPILSWLELRGELAMHSRYWPRPNPQSSHLAAGELLLGVGARWRFGTSLHAGCVLGAGAALASFRFIESVHRSLAPRVQAGLWLGMAMAERGLIFLRITTELFPLFDVAGEGNHLQLGGVWLSLGMEVGRDT